MPVQIARSTLPGRPNFIQIARWASLDALDLLPTFCRTFCRSYRNAADRFEKILGKAVWATAGAHSRSIATASDSHSHAATQQPQQSHSHSHKAIATASTSAMLQAF
jgi:hypothetical protein